MSTETPPLTTTDAIVAISRSMADGALASIPLAVLVRHPSDRPSAHLVTDIQVVHGQIWIVAEADPDVDTLDDYTPPARGGILRAQATG